MPRHPVRCILHLAVTVPALMAHGISTAQAFTLPLHSSTRASMVVATAGGGIDMVRMPGQPPLAYAQPPAIPPAAPKPALPVAPQPVAPEPPPKAAPLQPSQPIGRTFRLPVQIGSVPTARQKGWLGVSSDPLELPLALSLGLRNANGALIVETTAGGPAAVAGVRFGDIILGFNGSAIDSIDALRQRVSATMPGAEVVLEVWRITNDDGDFLRTLRRLGESGNAAVM
jgi:membrane-associated protease RseP (regulator of RpoE activity)